MKDELYDELYAAIQDGCGKGNTEMARKLTRLMNHLSELTGLFVILYDLRVIKKEVAYATINFQAKNNFTIASIHFRFSKISNVWVTCEDGYCSFDPFVEIQNELCDAQEKK